MSAGVSGRVCGGAWDDVGFCAFGRGACFGDVGLLQREDARQMSESSEGMYLDGGLFELPAMLCNGDSRADHRAGGWAGVVRLVSVGAVFLCISVFSLDLEATQLGIDFSTRHFLFYFINSNYMRKVFVLASMTIILAGTAAFAGGGMQKVCKECAKKHCTQQICTSSCSKGQCPKN